jgi:hypothetical protein
MVISENVLMLSDEGIISILRDAEHVNLFGDESLTELREILQINLDMGDIDEIEVLIVLSGE